MTAPRRPGNPDVQESQGRRQLHAEGKESVGAVPVVHAFLFVAVGLYRNRASLYES